MYTYYVPCLQQAIFDPDFVFPPNSEYDFSENFVMEPVGWDIQFFNSLLIGA